MIPYTWLEEAAERIAPHVRATPLSYDPNNDLFLKWENHQVTGSFKARGALNKVLNLQPWEIERGLVTASAGNHGQGVALAAQLVGAQATIFASEHAVAAKIAAMQALGAEVRLVAGGYGEAEKAGIAFANEYEAVWISPYNDGQVIAGQGTLGLELLQELANLPESTWVVPVGGGGLIAGIGAALEAYFPPTSPIEDSDGASLPIGKPRLVGVQSTASPFMHALFTRGAQTGVVELETLADGLSGPVEDQSLTIPLVRSFVDEIVLVEEDEIQHAIVYAWERYRERIEGSAAVALAAVLELHVHARPAVVVLTGGNIQPEVHQALLDRSSQHQ